MRLASGVPHLLALALIGPALASAAPADGPRQMVGLFVQGCVPFAGDAARLRHWAEALGLAEAPPEIRTAFLHGAPGQVFDGSNGSGRFALVSSDDGLCSVVTDRAEGPALTEALEAGLRQAGLAFRLVIERDDKNEAAIHDREYLATRNGRGWRILEATIKGAEGQAMLTAGPE